MWPVHINLSDNYTDYRRRGVYIDGPVRGASTRTSIGWLARPLRGTGVRLVRLADRLG